MLSGYRACAAPRKGRNLRRTPQWSGGMLTMFSRFRSRPLLPGLDLQVLLMASCTLHQPQGLKGSAIACDRCRPLVSLHSAMLLVKCSRGGRIYDESLTTLRRVLGVSQGRSRVVVTDAYHLLCRNIGVGCSQTRLHFDDRDKALLETFGRDVTE